MTAFAKRMDGISGSAIREIFKYLGDPNLISFGGGNPSKESFPVDAVAEISERLIRENGTVILQYGATEGYMPLRNALIEHILAPKGLTASLDELLVTSGSMQGLDLISKVFLDPGDVVLTESPTFLGALQIFNMFQAKSVPVPMDDDGVIIAELERLIREKKPKFFYCIPTFQNPTGRTLPAERRMAIAELAAKYNVLVIQDDPYCELRYSGTPEPTIKSFDKAGQVLLLNSFSKIISPGLRVGSVFGDKDILRKLTIAKQGADTHSANLSQAIVAEFLNKGLLPGHIRSILPAYAERLNAMLETIDAFFPDTCRKVRPMGGLFVWCELREDLEVLPLFKRSVEECKVAFVPGEHFFPASGMGKNTLRLNFSSETPENIRTGVERLGKLLRSV